MSSNRANEAHPLMGKSQPTAPVDPGYLPPPYSSLVGTQSQAYTPIPPPTQPPYPTEMTSAQAPYPMPMQMPMPQVHAPYPMHDGKGMPMPLPVYAPTTYDPVSSVPTVSPNQTVVITTSPRNVRSRKSRCIQVFMVIVIILVALSMGLSLMRKSRNRKEAERLRHQQEEAERRFEETLKSYQWPTQNYNDRYKRMVPDDQPLDIDDHPSFGKSVKSKKLNRKRRSSERKDTFRKHKKAHSHQKKGSKKGKKYHR